MRIGERIRDVRLAKGLLQRGLGERAGIERGLICRIERGRGTPSLANLTKIAAALGVPLYRLFHGVECAKPGKQHPLHIGISDRVLRKRLSRISERERLLVMALAETLVGRRR